jgi:hypothetical protein
MSFYEEVFYNVLHCLSQLLKVSNGIKVGFDLIDSDTTSNQGTKS